MPASYVTWSRRHLKELEKDSWTYVGYDSAKKNLIERSIGKRKKQEVIILSDSEDEEPPPPKVGLSEGVFEVINIVTTICSKHYRHI